MDGELMRGTYTKGEFFLDAVDDETFSGFTAGNTWNGWECPLFPLVEADRIAAAFREMGFDVTYDEGVDAFSFTEEGFGHEETEEYIGMDIPVSDATVRVYPIGTNVWTWETAEPEE